jgi:hypothetical protein
MPIYVPGKVVLDSGNQPAAIAGVAPTLDYRFARDKSEIETVSLTDKLTFTRAATCAFTNAGGNLELAGANVTRFDHNQSTRQSLGLMVEEARTNQLTYSENFSTWGLVRLTQRGDVAVAPNATTTADKLVESSQNDNRHARLDVSALTGSYTFSCFMKASERTFGYLAWGTSSGKSALFNLSTGVVAFSSGCTATIQALPDAWHRCIITITAENDNFACIGPATASTTNLYAYQGDGASGIFVWGAQAEAGSSATSYIQTVASTVTRTESAIVNGTGVITGTYTMVEKPAGCAAVSGSNINMQTGYTAERVMVFPAALSAGQITSIRSAM